MKIWIIIMVHGAQSNLHKERQAHVFFTVKNRLQQTLVKKFCTQWRLYIDQCGRVIESTSVLLIVRFVQVISISDHFSES